MAAAVTPDVSISFFPADALIWKRAAADLDFSGAAAAAPDGRLVAAAVGGIARERAEVDAISISGLRIYDLDFSGLLGFQIGRKD